MEGWKGRQAQQRPAVQVLATVSVGATHLEYPGQLAGVDSAAVGEGRQAEDFWWRTEQTDENHGSGDREKGRNRRQNFGANGILGGNSFCWGFVVWEKFFISDDKPFGSNRSLRAALGSFI